jgi:site-specific DNA-methyltransferase (adenine-specific)
MIHTGRWQDVLPHVECDALITDPPFSARAHAKMRAERYQKPTGLWVSVVGLEYDHIGRDGVYEIVRSWSPRTRGWMCFFTSHDLTPAYEDALKECGRYVFAPLACVQHGANIRLCGDGPANWTTWLVVARPRNREFSRWGALPGAYVGQPHDVGCNSRTRNRIVKGSKPLWMMSQIVRDYSRAGDLVCDPFAGSGTTLVAAHRLGRRAIGAEARPEIAELANERLSAATEQQRLALTCESQGGLF